VAESWIEFSEPLWLLGLVLCVLPALLAWRAKRRGSRIATANVCLQALAVAAVAFALARPGVPLGAKAALPYLILRDVSASTRGQSDRELDWPAELPAQNYDFAASVAREGPPPAEDRTNAAAALRLAAARRKEVGGVVIWTDGQFTDSAWRGAAASLAVGGGDVLIVPMESPPGDARIVELQANRRGPRVELRVTVSASGWQRRRLTIRRQDRPETPLLTRELTMPPGDSVTIRLSDSPPADQAAVYRAALDAGDAFEENDRAAAMVLPSVQRVAFVGADDAALRAALDEKLNMPVDSLDPAAGSQPAWTDYAAVVLVDATGTLLDAARRSRLARYVRGGGGLVLIGAGPHRSPADRADPLNAVAALQANPHQRRPLKLAVVLDASGSMADRARDAAGRPGQIKFDLACQAVLSLKRHLTAGDAMSVIAFSDSPSVVYDSAGGRIDFGALGEALGAVRPAGPTRAHPALGLATADAPRRGRDGLVVLVSDLRTEPFDVPAMAERFTARKWSLAVVATQARSDAPPGASPLERLARSLGAPLIRGRSLRDLADVFVRLLRDARGDAIRRGDFSVVVEAPPFGAELGPPPLDAYLLCAAAPDSRVLLRAGGDPILARRRVGLGRSAALALPIQGRYNAAWRSYLQRGDLLAAAVLWSLRPAGDEGFTGELERTDAGARLRIRAGDDDVPINFLKLSAMVEAADGQSHASAVDLRQTAPGVYEATLGEAPGPLGVVVRQGPDARVVWRGSMGRTYAREFAATGANWSNLRQLARLTGGRIVSTNDLGYWTRRWAARRYTPLWPWLLAAAVVAMLLDWATARIWRPNTAPAARSG